jgi:MerR family transcriptional regulator, light-induced transcriptional regulator
MGAVAPPPPPVDDGSRLLEALLAALLAADQVAAQTVVDRAHRLGWTIDDVRFGLIVPALHEVGDAWERGEIGVAEEHLATSVCQWLLFTLAGQVRRPPRTGARVVVGCSEGELHALGALLVANVLAEHGWTVLLLGATTPVAAWRSIVAARHPDVVAVSTTGAGRLPEVGPTLHEIRRGRPDCLAVVGGQAYAGRNEAAAELGADLLVADIRELPARLPPNRGA